MQRSVDALFRDVGMTGSPENTEPMVRAGHGPGLRLFVYGTLRSGGVNHRLIAGRARLLGRGVVPGRLVRIGWYPGLVGASEPSDRVVGEVYELGTGLGVGPLWDELDAYEGCSRNCPLPHEFERVTAEAEMADGRTLGVWVYRYLGLLRADRIIPGGDFVSGELDH